MRKEFIIKRIDTSPDGSPNVIISLTSAKEFQEETKNSSRFDPSKMINPANMDDMMKDLTKIFSGIGGMSVGVTSLKIDVHEYKEMNLSVGDKVYLDLTKNENTGI